jgi:plastocyanin
MTRSFWMAVAAALMLSAAAAACGGGGSSQTPTTPTPAPTPTPGTGGGNPTTATITIGANGAVSPSSVTIAPGGRVTMINNHNRAHDMSSDPHPEHTQCPEINQIGFLNPGQQRTSGNFNTARTCGFHDHNEDTNPNLQGRIIIQ